MLNNTNLTDAYMAVFIECLTPLKDEMAGPRLEIRDLLRIRDEQR